MHSCPKWQDAAPYQLLPNFPRWLPTFYLGAPYIGHLRTIRHLSMRRHDLCYVLTLPNDDFVRNQCNRTQCGTLWKGKVILISKISKGGDFIKTHSHVHIFTSTKMCVPQRSGQDHLDAALTIKDTGC